MRLDLRALLPAVLVTLGCAGGATPSGHAQTTVPRPIEGMGGREHRSAVDEAWASYEASRYGEAEAAFRVLSAKGEPRARVGLASVLLVTGRYAEAAAVASEIAGAPAAVALELVRVRGEALLAQGKLEEAESTLAGAAGDPAARRIRLVYGTALLEEGKLKDAQPVLMTLVEEYNSEKIPKTDARALAMVGRAAMLLGSPEDANDAFNEAERAGSADEDTLLWRADLFLDNYDSGHAEEALNDLLARAPHHPEALVRMAEVKLASNLDFESAEDLARKALLENPRSARAEFVLAGVALRDMNFDLAKKAIDRGLETNPNDLDLLSLQAASRFLADDASGFERAKQAVLSRNPRYSRLYQIIGEYAEWEHRYDEIVTMMREALLADPNDAKVRAQLGFNLIRSGEEQQGVAALARAFSADPFNVRVYNTLNLYEKQIPVQYETVSRGRFTLRYSKEERGILDRYVPGLLDRAWATFTKKYGFTPATPVGVELYPSREHFAVRTSGLPQTFIQGVCFGRTLAAMSPRTEKFNLGMTLWHELAHVFHIQLSRSHVPRWFTEGLAEYETLVERPEWRREHDAELYDAFERGKIPALADMNRAFSHAEDMQDMATAYYASTQLVAYIVERWGMPKVRLMLQLWGEGKRTPDVVRGALGASAEDVDRDFRAALSKQLSRYRGQFRPPEKPEDIETAERAARVAPKDADRQAALALSLLNAGNDKEARAAVARALAIDATHPLGLWIDAQMAKASGDRAHAARSLARMIEAGHDGYFVRQALSEVVTRPDERRAALEAAHKLDPLEAAPLRVLSAMALEARDDEWEIGALRKLTMIDENDGGSYRRLLSLLLGRRLLDEARKVGEGAVWADVESTLTHRLYAEVLFAAGDRREAIQELTSAVLGKGSSAELLAAHRRLSDLLEAEGDRSGAAEHRRAAQEIAKDARTGPI